MAGRSWSVLLVLAGMALRVTAALRPGLWADEIFSLAMATGHSLEHPAATADPSLGDFIEPREAESPAALSPLRRASERARQEPGRVIRAVLLSDTSPPLYYLLLNSGPGSSARGMPTLRLFSVWWAVLSLPLLWLVGRKPRRHDRAAWSACLLFAFSPVAFFYSVEGRMYSLVWFLGLALAWLTLRLARAAIAVGLPRFGCSPARRASSPTTSSRSSGSPASAGSGWMPARRSAERLLLLAGATLLAVLPWYLAGARLASRAGGSAATGSSGDLAWPRALGRPFALAGSLLSGSTMLGGWRWADRVALVLAAGASDLAGAPESIRELFSRQCPPALGWLAGGMRGSARLRSPSPYDDDRNSSLRRSRPSGGDAAGRVPCEPATSDAPPAPCWPAHARLAAGRSVDRQAERAPAVAAVHGAGRPAGSMGPARRRCAGRIYPLGRHRRGSLP